MPILKHEERIGSIFADRYRIDSILGRGGMGVVFKGEDLQDHKTVAIKLLHYEYAERPEVVSRFIREANTVVALKHPNIVEVFDLGQDADGTVYLVLEFLEGKSLGDRLAELGVLGPVEASDILLPVMDALAYAHGMGVIHRDLKPDNILVSLTENGKFVPKLLDFGIAKTLTDGQTALTQTGFVLGTPEYMSPEQASGDAGVGVSADIYSMGVVWYEVLSGSLPTGDLSGTAVLIAAAIGRTIPLVQKAPWLPQFLVETVDRAIQVDSKKRPESMRVFERMMASACGIARKSGEHRPPPGTESRRQTRGIRLRDSLHDEGPSIASFKNVVHGDGYELGPTTNSAVVARTPELPTVSMRKSLAMLAVGVVCAGLAVGGLAYTLSTRRQEIPSTATLQRDTTTEVPRASGSGVPPAITPPVAPSVLAAPVVAETATPTTNVGTGVSRVNPPSIATVQPRSGPRTNPPRTTVALAPTVSGTLPTVAAGTQTNSNSPSGQSPSGVTAAAVTQPSARQPTNSNTTTTTSTTTTGQPPTHLENYE